MGGSWLKEMPGSTSLRRSRMRLEKMGSVSRFMPAVWTRVVACPM
jgi:hypothetical protein